MNKAKLKQIAKKYIKSPAIKKAYHFLGDKKRAVQYYFTRKQKQKYARRYHHLPLEDKVVFANFNGKGYGCNPKYIAQEIIKRKLPWDLVWLVTSHDNTMPTRIRQIPFEGEESYKELATAKVIVNNVKGDLNFCKRPGQHYIQTWHASFSPKLLEKDAGSTLPSDYILESKYNSRDSDLFLSNSKAQTEEYRRAFWCNCEILECGLPRNDVFFCTSQKDKERIKSSLHLSSDTKIVLFAPTFRSGQDTFDTYGLDYSEVLNAITTKFSGEWVLLVRLHPNIVLDSTMISQTIVDASKYPDMQDLLIISDVLITDYSSSMFDMAEMKKPVFLFANDIPAYQKLRGLKPIYFKLPFPFAETNEKLVAEILNFDYAAYLDAICDVIKKYGTYDHGNASKTVVDKIEEWMR